MKVLYLLAIFVLTVSAVPIEERNQENGENGWFVPEFDGSTKWMTIAEGEKKVAEFEAIEEQGIITNSVYFYLYTKSNPTKGEKITESANSIAASNFNKNHKTVFIIHGWTQSYTAGMNTDIRNAFLGRGDHNIIVVDWARARFEYANAVAATPKVGKKIAALIDTLKTHHGMSMDTLTVVGHSLGAHCAGHTGKNVKAGRINTIVGLDTALPLFLHSNTKKRLAESDGVYVEAIHTNGGGLGFLKPLGNSDFYPNGGKSQPGCWYDVTGACDHGRSTTYYAECVKNNNFPSMKCGSYQDASKNNCGGTYSSIKMGADSNKHSANGQYYVPVNSKSPFGMG